MGVKLGQKWAVKDGNLLASNRVGSRFFNKEFDFSRASNGTYVDRDGLLKTAELYNLVSHSEIFTSSSTYYFGPLGASITSQNNLAPNGNYTASEMLSTGQGKIQTQYKALPANTTYTLSVYVKNVNATIYQTRILADGGSGGSNIVSVDRIDEINTETWTRVTHTFTTHTTAQNYIFYISNGVPTDESIQFWGAQLVEGTEPLAYQYTNGRQGLPRISFEDGVGHLLLEPQRSNLVTYSNSYNFWTKDDITLTSGQSGVYGTNDAWLIQGNTNSSRHNINRPLSVVTGQHCFSLYAKAKELQYIQIASAQTTEEYANFDLSDGSVGNVGSRFLDAKATNVGNGWYRLSVYTNNGFNSFYISLIQSKTDAWLPTYSGANSTDGLYIQHAQLESGSYPTSIIKTTTTSVTRLADVCNNSGSAQDFNSEEGVLYAEIAGLTDGGEVRRISINDGSTNNRVIIELDSTTNRVRAFSVTSGATQAILVDYLTDSTQFAKIAIKYKENDFALWVNGVEESTDLSGSVPIGLNKLSFNDGSTNNFYGKVRNLQVFTEALSDAELISLTT